MQNNYYQNIIYPLQDKVLEIIGAIPVDFYLTGGTALSRGYLNHRYSDDLDFFVNNANNFREQVEAVIKTLSKKNIEIQVSVADVSFVRVFINNNSNILKIDFVNDVPYRGEPTQSSIVYPKTDTILNILTNKITALGRYAAKDIVDIVFISKYIEFNWQKIFQYVSEKDMWMNPIEAAKIIDEFPLSKLNEVIWIGEAPEHEWFDKLRKQIIIDILEGNQNSLKRN